MILVEKLSLFNIDVFRKLYDINKNAYSCNESFFDIYDNETFVTKYVIRKQVKLFKVRNEYIGYIWYEYPDENGLCNIYSLEIMDAYIDIIDFKILEHIKSKCLKFDMIDTSKAENIMDKLQFTPISQTLLMKMKSSELKFEKDDENYMIRHFKKHRDEKLRCHIQNSVFNDKSRLPLTVGDIYIEEDENYYLDECAVFICNTNGTTVGYGQVIYNRGNYTIVNLGILEEYRGQGYGEKLIRYLINLCSERFIRDVHIRVDKKNLKAVSLYNKVGFKEYNLLTTWSKIK